MTTVCYVSWGQRESPCVSILWKVLVQSWGPTLWPHLNPIHLTVTTSHVSPPGELGLQHVRRGGRWQAFSPEQREGRWLLRRDGWSNKYRPASSWGSYVTKEQQENIGTERHVACSVTIDSYLVAWKHFYWNPGLLQGCFLKDGLACHHGASLLLPLFVAGFREMGYRLCFLAAWWWKTTHSSLPLGPPLQWLSSPKSLKATNGGSVSADIHFITLSMFHLLEGSQWVSPTPKGNTEWE